MRSLFSIAYLVVLVCCTLLAVRMWYTQRGTKDPAEKQLWKRFVLGVGIFWLIAIAGYFGGFFAAQE